MSKLIDYLVLRASGIALLVYCFAASDSVSSEVPRVVEGSDHSIWLFIGGAALMAIGAGGVLRGSKQF